MFVSNKKKHPLESLPNSITDAGKKETWLIRLGGIDYTNLRLLEVELGSIVPNRAIVRRKWETIGY